MNWFRWYHNTTTDPKLALVAYISGQPMHLVIAVWASMLEVASQSVPRGSIASFDPECQQVTLHTTQNNIERILDVMTSKNMIDKHQIIAWNKRQCDPTSAERVRKYRENKKMNVTHVTDVTVTPVTLRNVTPEEKRRDSNKKQATTKISEDFSFSEQHTLLSEGLNLQAQFDAFKDYHYSKGTAFKDWGLAFNNWLRNSKKFNKSDPQPTKRLAH